MGFTVEVEEMDQLAMIKAEKGVPRQLDGCHTAEVDGYIIEGHAPADAITRLLAERPDVVGLAVPGMPVGSPGMETGGQPEPYDVLTFDAAGATTVYESH